MPTAGVSGLAVTLTTAGGVLMVAAIRNQSPIDVMKAVLKRPTSGTPLGSPFSTVQSGVAQVAAGTSAAGSIGTAVGNAISAGGNLALVAEARKHLGARYVFATAGPSTFDCSGLVVYCLRKTLFPSCPRFTTYNASSVLKNAGWNKVSPAQFSAGDVIIRSGHMAIAISNSRMIHAPHTGTVVKEAAIFDKANWWGYRR